MDTLVVVTQAGDWPVDLAGVRVVTARSYLTDAEFIGLRHAKVFNLCRHYRYQSFGYYVSLLAEARGHKPLPTVLTTQDLRSQTVIRIVADDLADEIAKSLARIDGDRFEMSIYFGRAAGGRHERLAAALFRAFPAPLLRASFTRSGNGWELRNVSAVPTSAVPDSDREEAFDAARAFFSRRYRPPKSQRPSRFDLAILYDPDDPTSPSDPEAVKRFVDAASDVDIDAEVIGRADAGRLLEFDALFIRATTSVDHYTYRFARRASAEGLVVIDDPVSILRCTNKVYLAEILARNGVSTPKTEVVSRDNRTGVAESVGFPCILKAPDSSSSLGVFKVMDPDGLNSVLDRLLTDSDLVIAQEFVPTEFDWRVGILDRRPLFASRYFMAPNHWQIIRHDATSERMRYGRWETVPVNEVPQPALEAALKAANLIGDGFYGVDVKQVGERWMVIEVNDNPNVERGVEDLVLKDDLYRQVIAVFLRRLEAMTEVRRGG